MNLSQLASFNKSKKLVTFLNLLKSTILIFLIYSLMRHFYFQLFSIPEYYYFQESFMIELFKDNLTIFLTSFCPFIVLLFKYKKLQWSNIEQGNKLKIFLFFVSFIIAYTFSTYEYNFIYNQSHYLDRFILFFVAFLVLFNPIFVALFLPISITVLNQFNYPLSGYSLTDKRILFEVLILFVAFLCINFIRKHNSIIFIFMSLYLYSISYFISGVSKLHWGWLVKNKIYNLFVSSYVNGWLGFFDQSMIIEIANFIQPLNHLILFGALVIELATLFLLLRKNLTFLVLSGVILFHVGVFLASGIFFWKWILLNLGLIFLLKNLDNRYLKQLYSIPFVMVFILIVLFSPFYFRAIPFEPIQSAQPIDLTWYDTRLNNFYEMEAIGVSGKVYKISRNFMSPYDIVFVQNRFHYLNPEKVLVGTYGATLDWTLTQAIDKAQYKHQITKIEIEKGFNAYNQDLAEKFDYFLQTYFNNLNHRKSKKIFINHFSAPHHLWTFAKGDDIYQLQEKVKKVQIRYIQTLFNQDNIQVLDNKIIRVIDIP